jgi:hypothetical protein
VTIEEEKRKELADSLFGDIKSSHHLNREEADKEARRRLYCPFSKVLHDVPRKIPPPVVLNLSLISSLLKRLSISKTFY